MECLICPGPAKRHWNPGGIAAGRPASGPGVQAGRAAAGRENGKIRSSASLDITVDHFRRGRNDTGRSPGWFPTARVGLKKNPPSDIQRSGALRESIRGGLGVLPGWPGESSTLLDLFPQPRSGPTKRVCTGSLGGCRHPRLPAAPTTFGPLGRELPGKCRTKCRLDGPRGGRGSGPRGVWGGDSPPRIQCWCRCQVQP
jgi:hypothetical protein